MVLAGRLCAVATAAAIWAVVLASSGFSPCASAAEIRLRAQCQASAAVVTLGDLAEILSSDRRQAEALAAIELFAAPAPGTQRYVRLREIQDLLLLKGVSLAEHSFSGASQTAVSAAAVRTQAESFSPQAARRAQQRLREAIAQYLSRRVAGASSWNIEPQLDALQVRALAGSMQPISVSGGTPPWHGRQTFQVTFQGAAPAASFAVEAVVTPPPQVVVTTRSIPRGAIVAAEDVELQAVNCREGSGEYSTSAEEVVGRQTTRALAAGVPFPRDAVRQPLLVRRGDVVTVHARSPGVHVRITARAREDGSLGDLVSVESLHDRKTFLARVCDSRELEVFAGAVRVQDAPVARSAASLPLSAGERAGQTLSVGTPAN